MVQAWKASLDAGSGCISLGSVSAGDGYIHAFGCQGLGGFEADAGVATRDHHLDSIGVGRASCIDNPT